MKGLGKTIIGISALTCFFILYVHGQVMLLQVSYSLNKKSIVLTKKTDEYRQLKFQVDQLKAPRLLEGKMKQMSIELALPKEVRVVRVPMSPEIQVRAAAEEASLQTLTQRFENFIGRWVGVAQAKTES